MKPMCFDVLFKGSKVNEFQHLISHISLAVNESSPDCHRHSHSPIFVFDPFDRNSSIDSWKFDKEGNRLHAASTSSNMSVIIRKAREMAYQLSLLCKGWSFGYATDFIFNRCKCSLESM